MSLQLFVLKRDDMGGMNGTLRDVAGRFVHSQAGWWGIPPYKGVSTVPFEDRPVSLLGATEILHGLTNPNETGAAQ